jgi:hypothetical protein
MDRWNPWRVTALAMALVMATALVTGLVVANWSGSTLDGVQPAPAPTSPRLIQQPKLTGAKPAPAARATPAAPAVPTRDVVDACNRYAAVQVGESDRMTEVVKDAALGAVVGAAIGAAGGAVAGGGKGAGKGVAIGGVVEAGGGTLYGLNENRRNDQKYRAAYSSCLQSRGYIG